MFELGLAVAQKLVVSAPEAVAVLCLLLIGVLPALVVAPIVFAAMAVEWIHCGKTAHH